MTLRLLKIFSLLLLLVISSRAYSQATMGSLDQNADQTQGQYTPMNLGYAGFNSLGMVQSAWLDPLQNLGEGQTKPAYSKYYWSPDLVLPVRLREGMITLINFPDWELIEDIFIGDNATFDGQISGPNTLLLYPRKGSNVGVDTNIIVFGRSGNRYVFYAKSEGVNTERLTNSIIDIEVIDAPQDEDKASGGSGRASRAGGGSPQNFNSPKSVDSTYTRRFQKNDWLKTIPMDPTKFRFDIEVYIPNPDDVIIAPERVWRDDIFTYIDLGEKALNMTQRPIVTLIVERIEVPVGFRTKGPNNRLIIVEGVGDMVMKNGKRIICLKMRRSDDVGLENISYAGKTMSPSWDVPPPLPNGDVPYNQGYREGSGFDRADRGAGRDLSAGYEQGGVSHIPPAKVSTGSGTAAPGGYVSGHSGTDAGFDYSKMTNIKNTNRYNPDAQRALNGYGYGSGFTEGGSANISIELGTDADVEKLESLWDNLSGKYQELNVYDPFFSVDTPADGQGKELFHLRVGPVDSLETGDNICSRLGRNGIFCSVVRTQ